MTLLPALLIIVSSLLDQALPLLLFRLIIQPQGRRARWQFYIICVLLFTLLCSILSFSSIHYLLKTAILALLKIAYCWVLSGHKLAVTIFLPVLDVASMYACESTVPFVLAFLFSPESLEQISASDFLTVFGILESRGLLYLLWGVTIFLLHRRKSAILVQHIRTSQWIILCSALTFLASFVVAFQWVADIQPDDLPRPGEIMSVVGVFPLIFLVLIILFFLLTLSLSAETARKFRLESELLQAEQQLAQQRALSSLYEQIRGVQHDFRNHMQIIASLAERAQDTSVQSYVQEILGSLAASTAFINTGVPAVDALMNSKFIHAKKYGIRVCAEICFPDPLDVATADLCTALFNLLDNAIEACQRNFKPENRRLELTLHQSENFLIICCSNPSERPPVPRRNGFRSSKAGAGHGIGLKQLQHIAEKYSGFFHAAYQDGIFTAKLALPQSAPVRQIHASYINTKEDP